tara:strand:- start:1008 stop:1172 length:165 start_codon:yes stop_codon:yes gene_type:complete
MNKNIIEKTQELAEYITNDDVILSRRMFILLHNYFTDEEIEELYNRFELNFKMN